MVTITYKKSPSVVSLRENCIIFPNLLTSLSGGSPAGDPRLLACWEIIGGGGQADGPDVLVQGDLLVQLHQGNVVVVGKGVIVLVGNDPL